MPPAWRCEPLADDALLLQTGTGTPPIDPDAGRRVHALMAWIHANAPDWLRETVPAYASLALFFDPARIDMAGVHRWVGTLPTEPDHTPAAQGRTVEIPVHYGGEHGQDLDSAAAELGLDPQTLIARHTAPLYTVAMLGFAPGFPYLTGLDPGLALPRLATPRTRVPAGSVGIGGAQTGIYPRESPGGWRLIGCTPLRLFDPMRSDSPALLAPGDRLRFVAVDAATFAALDTATRMPAG